MAAKHALLTSVLFTRVGFCHSPGGGSQALSPLSYIPRLLSGFSDIMTSNKFINLEEHWFCPIFLKSTHSIYLWSSPNTYNSLLYLQPHIYSIVKHRVCFELSQTCDAQYGLCWRNQLPLGKPPAEVHSSFFIEWRRSFPYWSVSSRVWCFFLVLHHSLCGALCFLEICACWCAFVDRWCSSIRSPWCILILFLKKWWRKGRDEILVFAVFMPCSVDKTSGKLRVYQFEGDCYK